jgi:mono/diheme cytochrome c family protein
MEFPIFQIPYLGNGMTIALDAVLHVVISHGIAIGVMAMIVFAEYLGMRRSSRDWEEFSKALLKPTIIIITGVGAVTGVGIWFITSALAPRGIGSMLRIFFWPWIIEWAVFTLEVIVILIYYFTWDSWTGQRKKRHVYLGISYVFLSLCSAFLITGILGFMLTSDGWPWDGSFWSAFFNPSFLPQLFLRTSGAFGLGALFSSTFVLFTRHEGAFRQQALRFFGRVALLSLGGVIVFTWWYFKVVPSPFKSNLVFSILTSNFSQVPELFWVANLTGALLILSFSLVASRGLGVPSKILILPILLISIGFVTEFERAREFIRGPYLMPGYMYANQVLLKENPLWDTKGTLASAYWYHKTVSRPDIVAQGSYLFAQNCSVCHTIGGINDIRNRVKGRSQDGIFVILAHTHEMVPFMAPFSGTEHERRILADFLYRLSRQEIAFEALSRFVPLQQGKKDE